VNLRLVQFSLGPDKRSQAEAIANEIVPKVRAQPGCERCEFFGDDEAGDFGIVVLWESPETANAASEVIGPQLGAALQQLNVTNWTRRLFDIYTV